MQKVYYRKDYLPPDYTIDTVFLEFDFHPQATRVKSRLSVHRQGHHDRPLVLDGSTQLALVSAQGAQSMVVKEDKMIVVDPRDHFILEIETHINPSANTQLMGLYLSNGLLCTQCEAEGFRRITYFLDRPDIMARYHVTLRADKQSFPVLLSNGHCVSSQDFPDGRHQSVWEDPHPKPCYLFACVAGDLHAVRDQFETAEGRTVDLAIWCASQDTPRCHHALQSLKRAMRWDETRFGRLYDLDVFNIVAVNDFNFGAMENKGLNIFNSKYVLADDQTATDADFDAIEGVIAHEYLHNWSGNRVTCRDWFQLSLKEGFTVYRDQEYSADQGSRAVKRIEDVRVLRNSQFIEDASPLAHPVRPESYIEINNFYTATVYNKGAEVIRMLETLLGWPTFRAGCDLYFNRHDGQAVTCDDFIAAMEDASGQDLTQFKNWYGVAGTPIVKIDLAYVPKDRRVSLWVQQSTPDTPGQAKKPPMDFPLSVAFFDSKTGAKIGADHVLRINQPEHEFYFDDIDAKPVFSVLRGFSAPIKIDYEVPREDLAMLALCDDDPFARYEALQSLALEYLKEEVVKFSSDHEKIYVDPLLIHSFEKMAQSPSDPAFKAMALMLPSESYIGSCMDMVRVDSIHAVRTVFLKTLGRALSSLWRDVYERPQTRAPGEEKGIRALRGQALHYLVSSGDQEHVALAFRHVVGATNMTDRLTALSILCDTHTEERDTALEMFYQQWQHNPLVIDKWFSVQALSMRADTLDHVSTLLKHADFNLHNPNRLRALLGSFSNNQVRFHALSGAGYRLLADHVLAVDALNAQVAARLAAPLGRWQRYDQDRAKAMRGELERVSMAPGLSQDVREVVAKSLSG